MKRDGLYIQMFSVHGLVRSRNIEMGRDADTGGQVKYVVELAQTLGRLEGVAQVDLFTRLIQDKTVSPDYCREVEALAPGVRIVRIKCGGFKYLRKELLWPHLDEYVDRVLTFTKREGRIPEALHGHYADGGYVAMSLSPLFNVPFVFTGHSLGRVKKQKLLGDGMSEEETNAKYAIDQRIGVEDEVIHKASLIVTSTSQEISKQYGLYEGAGEREFKVIPPGVDLDRFYPYYEDRLRSSRGKETKDDLATQIQAALLEELNRFFMKPDRPLILSLCRPDKRKNIAGLIRCYGEDRDLQAIANLAVFAGLRKDISEMGENEKEVLTDILLLMDKYDLYGDMAIPKTHNPTQDVPALYRIAATSGGVFVNSALTEPFGLTLIESAGCGLPVVATNDGGPIDIINNCSNGELVDVADTEAMARAIKSVLVDRERWKSFSTKGINGVKEHYTWDAHCRSYLQILSRVLQKRSGAGAGSTLAEESVGERLTRLEKLIITDIDNTLTGDEGALREFLALMEEHKDRIGFCLATGRTVEATLDLLTEMRVPAPEILISAVGTEIHYARSLIDDRGWAAHISQSWDREAIVDLLSQFSFLQLQEHENQRTFKVSYYMQPHPDRIPMIYEQMQKNRLRFNVVYSHQSYLDVLPYRASKGRAVKYLCKKWHFPPENILICGDSGNDEEMLCGAYPGVVVSNYSQEMEKLKGRKNIYFSPAAHAAGILDGIANWGFLEPLRGRERDRRAAGGDLESSMETPSE